LGHAEQQKQLMQALEEHMAPDRYGEYPISSLYYDTADYRLIRTSLKKPIHKEKFRVRRGTDFLGIEEKFSRRCL